MTARGITIVVPAFDEQDGIEGVVSRLSGLALAMPVEILVVDDGSTDGTVGVLERIGPKYPKLRVITHERNRGYGAALKTGFSSARHEIVVITDADGTYPENRIAELLARIDAGAEMAVGARTGPEVEVPLLRRPAKAILRLLASYLAGVRIPDLNSGLRAIRRDLVKTYRPILSDGFSFTTTITLSALTNGHRVDWVSIDYKKRQGSSKIRPIRDTLGFASLIVRTVLYFNPLKVFFPVAFLIGLALLGSVYVDVFVTSPANLSEKTILCFVALIQVLTVGLLADLVDKRSRL
jgi:glycosyltransferase involved in cell wall biosynthesis